MSLPCKSFRPSAWLPAIAPTPRLRASPSMPSITSAVVTEPGCNHVSLVSLAPATTARDGFGATELAVGTNPQGVAVYPQAGLAVVANAGSNSVSIVDIVNDGVPTTFTTDPIPAGVAIDLGTGKAVVTASGASLVDVFPVSTTRANAHHDRCSARTYRRGHRPKESRGRRGK